jgi:Uma2 family endonuclease
MASHAPHRRYTIAEYVQLEGYSNVRHEYLDGPIYAMAGGTPEHGTYAANVIALLIAALREQPCRVQTSDAYSRAGNRARHLSRCQCRVRSRRT